MYLSNYLSTYLSVCLSICLFIFLFIYLPPICLFAEHLLVYPFICLSIWLPVSLSVCLSVWLSIYLSGCLPICPSVYLTIWVSAYVSVHLSICPSSYLLYNLCRCDMTVRQGKDWISISTGQRIWPCKCWISKRPYPSFTLWFQKAFPFFTDSYAWNSRKRRLEQNHVLVWDSGVSIRSRLPCPKWAPDTSQLKRVKQSDFPWVLFWGHPLRHVPSSPGYGVALFF